MRSDQSQSLGFILTFLLCGTYAFGTTVDTNTNQIRHDLGRCASIGQMIADLNGDGCVNVLDVAMWRQINSGATFVQPDAPTSNLGPAEQIVLLNPNVVVSPGESAVLFFLIRNNTTPLLGYSLDVDIAAAPGATGTVTANVAATSFYEVLNLISAGGATLDPTFSVITDPGDGGVFINAITEDNSTVLAAAGVNDVLARVVVNASTDADGEFDVQLGPASVLSDGAAFPVPFTFEDGIVTIRQTVPIISRGSLAIMFALVLLIGIYMCKRPLHMYRMLNRAKETFSG